MVKRKYILGGLNLRPYLVLTWITFIELFLLISQSSPSAPRLSRESSSLFPFLYICCILISSKLSKSVNANYNFELIFQFSIFHLLIAFKINWEYPLIIKFLTPNPKLKFKPSMKASISAILLVTFWIVLALWRIYSLVSEDMIQPNPAFPSFPWEVPSKISLVHPTGGSHLHSNLSYLFILGYINGGLINLLQFLCVSTSQSMNVSSSLVVLPRILFITSVILAFILFKRDIIVCFSLLNKSMLISFQISHRKIKGEIF